MSEPADLDALHAIGPLRAAATIRERCAAITAAVSRGESPHFTLDRHRLDAVAARIEAVTRAAYPDLRIPYHSRWRHFEAGGVARKPALDQLLSGLDAADQARAHIDLTLVSVLLDAGAGTQWRYAEADTGQTFSRSEGLGVASFRAFMQGCFSSDPARPLQVDAAALQGLQESDLAAIFQVNADNPLVGLAGRAALLQRLGQAVAKTFGPQGRPGQLFDHWRQQAVDGALPAEAVLRALLDHFSGIWLAGNTLRGVPLGDCWPHPAAGGSGPTAGWVPFHKLSQWLSYSLLEPLQWAGLTVTGLDALTGLPEYRNGGLLLDEGVVLPRDRAFAALPRRPADPWVVEWRALTITLLDELAPRVRAGLGVGEAQLPLACMLEGGSWAAGRQVARERREGGGPPVQIDSDGTVF